MRSGGLGLLAFIRYTDSNVGPYDELLWLAPWGLRVGPFRAHSVTHIYVSSEQSRRNGRLEWGIPKQLGRFDVEPAGSRGLRVRVSAAAGPVAEFEITTFARSIAVSADALPRVALELQQVLDGQLFRVLPRLRGRLHRARFSRLAAHASTLLELDDSRSLGAVSLLGFTLVFPRAELRALGD